MASVGAKESQTATQTVSITAVPTTSHGAETSPVHKVSTIDQLDELLGDKNKVIMIEFFAEWCGPCKLIAKKLEAWANMYDVTIVKIDIDELEDVAIEYNVAGIPSFVFLKERQILEQLEGSQEEKIIAALEKHCKTSDTSKTHSSKSESKKKNVSPSPAPVEVPTVNTEESEKAEQ